MSSKTQKTSIIDEKTYADCKEFLRQWIEEDKTYPQADLITACCVMCCYLAQEVANLTQQQQSNAGTVFGSIIEQNKSFLNNIANKSS